MYIQDHQPGRGELSGHVELAHGPPRSGVEVQEVRVRVEGAGAQAAGGDDALQLKPRHCLVHIAAGKVVVALENGCPSS